MYQRTPVAHSSGTKHPDGFLGNERCRNSKVELNHRCPKCSYETFQLTDLRRHIRRGHTPNFKCTFCSFTTVFSLNLESHKNSHVLKQMLTCSKCSYTTNTNRSLRSHEEVVPTDIDKWKVSMFELLRGTIPFTPKPPPLSRELKKLSLCPRK